MTKREIKIIVNNCITPRIMCRIFLKYDRNYFYYFPLKANDKLFLGAAEDDFILDGYAVRRFRDITKAEIKNDICLDINIKEGVVDKIVVPDVDITSWETIFISLQKIGRNIIVEDESLDDDSQFAIGRIEAVYKNFIYLRHFDGDGIWQDAPYKIPYKTITSVSFGTRYVDIFSKYLGNLPDNFGKRKQV